jgi:DUF4097 and DUF4098 domain-containing protein YvlB
MNRLLFLLTLPAVAQVPGLRDNRDPQLECGRMSSCEVRDRTIAATGRFTVQSVHNGEVTVRGWTRSEVRVRVKVMAGSSRALSRVRTSITPGRVSFDGPEDSFFGWLTGDAWSVDIEVFVPHNTDVIAEAHNGRVRVSDIAKRVEAHSHNGDTRLERIAGDVRSSSHNGSMTVELAGEAVSTRRVELENHNGSIAVAMPRGFSASVSTEAHNGSVRTDFPMSMRILNGGHGDQDFTIGSGGMRLRLRTHNGSIRVRQL